MSVKAGLVGLPNVGKSTLFNALTKSSVPAQNYPFCTIDPHVAIANVPDPRSIELKRIYQSGEIIPANMMFVDIAGLVKGAAQGEGLGNQFLSHIRECDLILHVLRCFEDPDVLHTSHAIDPVDDYTVIMQELMLKDLETVQKRQQKVESLTKAARNDPKELKALTDEAQALVKILEAINQTDAKRVRELVLEAGLSSIQLLSSKDFLIIANIDERELEGDAWKNNEHYKKLVREFGQEKIIPISAKIESELAQLPDDQANELMDGLGLKESGLDQVIRRTYAQLGLITFFTCGPKEIHAWPIHAGITIRKASGEIHSDLERGFICAEVLNYSDLVACGAPVKAKEAGKVRIEGQDYITADGDIINVRFNV